MDKKKDKCDMMNLRMCLFFRGIFEGQNDFQGLSSSNLRIKTINYAFVKAKMRFTCIQCTRFCVDFIK